jgi:hypothetical protein
MRKDIGSFMKKSKSRIAFIVMATMLLATLSACGSSAQPESAPADEVTETPATQEEADKTEEGSNEVFIEPEEIVETAYFEENNVNFTSDRTFTVPFAVGTYDPDSLEYKEYKGIKVEPATDAKITFGEIKDAKCDKAGYKAFTFDYTVEGTIKVTVDTFDYDEDYSYEPQFPHVDLADYYTGKLLTYYPNVEKKEDGYDYIDKFTFNNKQYEISYFNTEKYGDAEETDWRIDEASDDSRMQWYEVNVSESHSVEVRVPENYDGLVLAVNLNGIKEYDTSAYFEYMGGKDRLVFEDDPKGYTYKPETSAFVKVSDL